jgi:hypothetical protein
MATHYLTVSWEEFHRDAKALAEILAGLGSWRGIVAISRGGLVPATIIARALNIRVVETVSVVAYDQFSRGDEETLGEPKVTKLPDFAGDGEGFLIVDDLAAKSPHGRCLCQTRWARARRSCAEGGQSGHLDRAAMGTRLTGMIVVFYVADS